MLPTTRTNPANITSSCYTMTTVYGICFQIIYIDATIIDTILTLQVSFKFVIKMKMLHFIPEKK